MPTQPYLVASGQLDHVICTRGWCATRERESYVKRAMRGSTRHPRMAATHDRAVPRTQAWLLHELVPVLPLVARELVEVLLEVSDGAFQLAVAVRAALAAPPAAAAARATHSPPLLEEVEGLALGHHLDLHTKPQVPFMSRVHLGATCACACACVPVRNRTW